MAHPSTPVTSRRLFPEEILAKLASDGRAEVTLAGRSFMVGADLLEDASSHHLHATLQGLGRALLVMHSPTDEQVSVDNARRIYEAARHPKSFVSLDGADHLLTRREDADYAADVLAAWSARYLPQRPIPQVPAEPSGTVLVEESGTSRLAQSIRAGAHAWTADEPIGVGEDLGPTPYDLLLAALGACTSMTLRMNADRRGFPLDHVSVRLSHRRSHAEDCTDPLGKPCTVDHIDRQIDLTGPLDEEQRARLLEIADRCPVHRTLTGEIRVSTTAIRPLVNA